MKCNFKWLSLYLDGELSQRKKDKLEEHLPLCENCAGKLEEMKKLEALTAQEKSPQVSEAYWESFSARVKNKLLLREKESPSILLCKRISAVFQISPFRLKLAAAVASVIIVAWVGKIYMDYRPAPVERQLQYPSIILPEKLQPLPESVETILPPAQVAKDEHQARRLIKSKPKEAVSAEQLAPAVPLKGLTPPAREELRYEAAPVQLPPEVVTGEKPVIDKNVTSNLRRITPKETEVLPVKKVDELLGAQLGSVAKPTKVGEDTTWELHVWGRRAGKILQPFAEKEATADSARDYISPVSAIREEIERLEGFILSETLRDKDIAYQVLGESYLELCVLSKDREDIDIAQKRIQEILQKPLYAETRMSLNNILTQLKNLEKSLE